MLSLSNPQSSFSPLLTWGVILLAQEIVKMKYYKVGMRWKLTPLPGWHIQHSEKKKKDSCLSRQHFFLLCNWVSNASPRGERGADAWILSHVLELLWWIPCCCSVTSCPTRCKPMDCSTPGFPVLHCLLELAQIQVHWVGDAIQPSHLLLPSSFAFNPSQGITTNKLEEGCCECYYTQRQPSCT